MQFDSFAEIINMSGYGSYVWSSVFIVLLVLVTLTIDSIRLKKKSLIQIKDELERAEKINQARKMSSSNQI